MDIIVIENIAGHEVTLLLAQHNWRRRPQLDLVWPGKVDEASSGEEERRPQADGLRLVVHYEYLLSGDELQAFRELMAGDKGALVAVPLYMEQWPAAEYDTSRRVGPSYSINFSREREYAVFAAGTWPVDPTYARGAPLHFGRVARWEELEGMDGDLARVKVAIDSDAPAVFRIDALTGNLPASWPSEMRIDGKGFGEELETGLKREAIGEGRELAHSGAQRENNLQRSFGVLMRDAGVGTAISFFASRKGMHTAFSAPAALRPGTPTPEAPHGTVCRFGEARLRFEYFGRDAARARVTLRTLPWEVNPDREYAMPRLPSLFKVTYRLPDPQYDFLTSADEAITMGGDVYAPAKIEGGGLRRSLRGFASESMTLKMHAEAGNPFMRAFPGPLEGTLWVDVYTCDPADPDGTVKHRFGGSFSEGNADGARLNVKLKAGGGMAEKEIGVYSYKPDCQVAHYSDACGVNPDLHKVEGTMAAIAGREVDITCGAAQAADYFRRGRLEVGIGSAFQRRAIIGSAPIAGGQRLTLDRELTGDPDGSAAAFLPGCSHERSDCHGKYGNYGKMKAHPHMPEQNPSIQSFDRNMAASKK